LFNDNAILLQFCFDEKEKTNQDAIDHLAEEFKLTNDERKRLFILVTRLKIENRRELSTNWG